MAKIKVSDIGNNNNAMINEVKQLVRKSIETRKNIAESLNNNETTLSENKAQLSKVETLIKEAMDLTRATNSAENKANRVIRQARLKRAEQLKQVKGFVRDTRGDKLSETQKDELYKTLIDKEWKKEERTLGRRGEVLNKQLSSFHDIASRKFFKGEFLNEGKETLKSSQDYALQKRLIENDIKKRELEENKKGKIIKDTQDGFKKLNETIAKTNRLLGLFGMLAIGKQFYNSVKDTVQKYSDTLTKGFNAGKTYQETRKTMSLGEITGVSGDQLIEESAQWRMTKASWGGGALTNDLLSDQQRAFLFGNLRGSLGIKGGITTLANLSPEAGMRLIMEHIFYKMKYNPNDIDAIERGARDSGFGAHAIAIRKLLQMGVTEFSDVEARLGRVDSPLGFEESIFRMNDSFNNLAERLGNVLDRFIVAFANLMTPILEKISKFDFLQTASDRARERLHERSLSGDEKAFERLISPNAGILDGFGISHKKYAVGLQPRKIYRESDYAETMHVIGQKIIEDTIRSPTKSKLQSFTQIEPTLDSAGEAERFSSYFGRAVYEAQSKGDIDLLKDLFSVETQRIFQQIMLGNEKLIDVRDRPDLWRYKDGLDIPNQNTTKTNELIDKGTESQSVEVKVDVSVNNNTPYDIDTNVRNLGDILSTYGVMASTPPAMSLG